MRNKYLYIVVVILILSSCASYTGDRRYSTRMKYAGGLMQLGMYDDARLHYEKILESTDDPVEKGRILNNLAVLYELDGEYEKAREYYKQSLEYVEDIRVFDNYKHFIGGM